MYQITYARVGDYLLPDIALSEPPPEFTVPLGRYGRMRRAFLREYRPIQYTTLLLSEKLFPHLRKVDEAANKRLDSLMSDIRVFNPQPDKTADTLAWATHMTEIKRTAEMMILDEVVYA
ncbi:MAG: TnpV protein [Clostridiales bacterium]|jgi:hypothetical protein|nr:TnpV protein [Clostridiales bacterium]